MADLTPLRSSGMDIDSMTAEQQQALQTLDQSEVDALAAIRTKLNSTDVTGFALRVPTGITEPVSPLRLDGGLVW